MLNNIYRAKEKKIAYVLHFEFGYTKQAIAQLMKISPQQMGQWIKEVSYELQIHQMGQEIQSLKHELMSLGYSPQKELGNDVIEFIENKLF